MKSKQWSLTREELLSSITPMPRKGVFISKHNCGRRKKGTIAGTLGINGYRYININKVLYLAHRLMWFYVYGEWPVDDIDHINGDRDDNRISNLRKAVRSQNNVNSLRPKNNTSGFKGAYFDKRRDLWAAEIWIYKRKKFLGYYSTASEAGNAYRVAAVKHYGEFAMVER